MFSSAEPSFCCLDLWPKVPGWPPQHNRTTHEDYYWIVLLFKLYLFFILYDTFSHNRQDNIFVPCMVSQQFSYKNNVIHYHHWVCIIIFVLLFGMYINFAQSILHGVSMGWVKNRGGGGAAAPPPPPASYAYGHGSVHCWTHHTYG